MSNSFGKKSTLDCNVSPFVPRSKTEVSQPVNSSEPESNKNMSYSQIAAAFSPSLSKIYTPRDKLVDSRPLCSFYIKGTCRNGNVCRFSHNSLCPNCQNHTFYPEDSEDEKKKHIEACERDYVNPDQDIECCICMEKVKGTKSGRFGLLSCDHPFCLDCIRHWRSNSGMESEVLRTCPICRGTSYFIIPSSVWITDKAEKESITENYKNKLSTIPCRHFNYGEGQCPFGSSCFYAHVFPDGKQAEYELRKIKTADEEICILNQVKLSDFFEAYRSRE